MTDPDLWTPDLWTTAVVDAGARYGIHPTWQGFEAPLAYAMYEPDPREAERLREKYADRPQVTVSATALGAVAGGTLSLFLTAHRGYTGSTRPNPDSLWFADIRPEEGGVEAVLEVPCTTLDAEYGARARRVDFLKIDVEGAEHAVLKGGRRTLDDVLAMRVELQFDDSFTGQTAADILRLAVDGCGFRLMRFDYNGRGQPLSYLVGDNAHGALCGCDAVFVRKPQAVAARGGAEAAAGLTKLAVFALRNAMADYAVLCLDARAAVPWTPPAAEPPLNLYLRKLFTFAALRLRAVSPELYRRARDDYRRWFAEPMLERHDVHQSDWLNP